LLAHARVWNAGEQRKLARRAEGRKPGVKKGNPKKWPQELMAPCRLQARTFTAKGSLAGQASTAPLYRGAPKRRGLKADLGNIHLLAGFKSALLAL